MSNLRDHSKLGGKGNTTFKASSSLDMKANGGRAASKEGDKVLCIATTNRGYSQGV